MKAMQVSDSASGVEPEATLCSSNEQLRKKAECPGEQGQIGDHFVFCVSPHD
jgi:hypothetical protein